MPDFDPKQLIGKLMYENTAYECASLNHDIANFSLTYKPYVDHTIAQMPVYIFDSLDDTASFLSQKRNLLFRKIKREAEGLEWLIGPELLSELNNTHKEEATEFFKEHEELGQHTSLAPLVKQLLAISDKITDINHALENNIRPMCALQEKLDKHSDYRKNRMQLEKLKNELRKSADLLDDFPDTEISQYSVDLDDHEEPIEAPHLASIAKTTSQWRELAGEINEAIGQLDQLIP